MKQYPKIDYFNKGIYGDRIIACDKIDGTNIRAEWSCKKGWYKFGTKTEMIDKNHQIFGKMIPIFLEKYGDSLPKVFADKYKKVENFVVFGEYVGENSFAGWHHPDDVMDIVLFDVNQYKRGFISPWEFRDNFGHLDVPKIIYEGKYTESFINDIRNNIFKLKEGVIVKGIYKPKNAKEEVWMVKVKSNEWLRKVKLKFGERGLMEELNNDKELYKLYV